MTRARREEGVVFLLVLIILVLTAGTVYALAASSTLQAKALLYRADRGHAELLARSGYAIGLRAVQDDATVAYDEIADAIESALDPWAILSDQTLTVSEIAQLRITVRDGGQKLNLNALVDAEGEPHSESREFLAALLEHVIDLMPGRNEEKLYDPAELADGMLDWLDRNEETRLGDDEASSWGRLGGQATPANRPLLALAELRGMPGVDAPLLQALEAYFTTQPLLPELGQAGVNPNTAPPHVLAAIYHGSSGDQRLLDESDVFAILRARRQGQIFCPNSTEEPCVSFASEIGRAGESVFPPLRFESQIFEIRSVATVKEARACVVATIDRKDPTEPRILSYRMECE